MEPVNHLSLEQRANIISQLKTRFDKNMQRHNDLNWPDILAKLEANAEKLWSLHQMETTGGEPDVIGLDKTTGEYLFYDCAPESPAGRRSLCFDRAAWESRKEHKPTDSAMELGAAMGIEILTEAEYRTLQSLGRFDTKTSSWIETPAAIRKLGGAIFADFRYGKVFVYHNGAESYYASRGFRGSLRV